MESESHHPNPTETSVIGISRNMRVHKNHEAFFVAANAEKVVLGNEAAVISATYCHCLNYFRTLDN